MSQQQPRTGQPSKSAGASTHDIDHAHDSRVDELSEERATRPEQRPYGPWVRASSLDAPPPRPGMVQRWVRITAAGADDPRNVSRRRREGWQPRPLDTIPSEFKEMAARADATQGVFVVDDLMLCEQPEEVSMARKRYIREQTDRQMMAVELELERSQVPGHAIQKQHSSAVSTGVGRRVQVREDTL